MLYKIQPAPRTDHITDDGTELTQRPYPIVCDDEGAVEGMALVARVVGFTRDLSRQELTLRWHEVAARHVSASDVVGLYVVIQDHSGNWSTLVTAVETFTPLADDLDRFLARAALDFKVTAPEPTGNDLRVSLRKVPYRIAVHATHCCLLHGCKYGNADCPVQTRETAQEYPCEYCPDEPITPAEAASADELLHHLRECVSALEEPLTAFKAAMPGLAQTLAAFRTSMNELDRKLTHGHPLPGDWNARR